MDFIFGRSLGFSEPEVPTEATEFFDAFWKAQSWSVKRREAGWLQFRLYRYNEDKEFKEAYTKVHKYVDQQVALALEKSFNEIPKEDGPPVRRRYILLDEMAKHIRDPVQLGEQLATLFFSWRDIPIYGQNSGKQLWRLVMRLLLLRSSSL
jgi:hypothetical protein